MKQQTSYEITFIVKEGKAASQVSKILESASAKVLKQEELGLRRFAYPIKKETEGYYFRIVFESEREKLSGIEKELSREKEILRYLLVVSLRESGEANRDRRDARPAKAEPAKVTLGKIKEEAKPDEIVDAKSEPVASEAAANIIEEEAVEKPAPKVETVKTEEKTTRPVEKSPVKSRKITKKAVKADAGDLDKKLAELVDED